MEVLKYKRLGFAAALFLCSLFLSSCSDSGNSASGRSPAEQKLTADYDREREASRIKVMPGEGLLLKADGTWTVIRIRSAQNNDLICYELKGGASLEASAELTAETLTVCGRVAERVGSWREELFLQFPESWQGVDVGVFEDASAPTSETEAARIPRRILWETDAGRRMEEFIKAKVKEAIESL